MSTTCRIIYDSDTQQQAAKRLAKATLQFFKEGLLSDRTNFDQWAEDFFWSWNECIYKLAPLVKDENWSAEDECRVVHLSNNVSDVEFIQKRTMLARYTDLNIPSTFPRLPISAIMIGPGNNPELTKSNIELLLEKKAYSTHIAIEITKVSLQRP